MLIRQSSLLSKSLTECFKTHNVCRCKQQRAQFGSRRQERGGGHQPAHVIIYTLCCPILSFFFLQGLFTIKKITGLFIFQLLWVWKFPHYFRFGGFVDTTLFHEFFVVKQNARNSRVFCCCRPLLAEILPKWNMIEFHNGIGGMCYIGCWPRYAESHAIMSSMCVW